MDSTLPGPDPRSAQSAVTLRVRFAETDLMGIVHHASYVGYLEVGRVEWLRKRGLTYAAWVSRGVHLPVVGLALTYRAPCRFDDELLVETSLTEVRAATLRFEYRIVRVADGMLCAEGWTRLACVDDRGAVRRLSADMVDALGRGEEGSPGSTT
jgi:acyl-CoA thioester hydrolase